MNEPPLAPVAPSYLNVPMDAAAVPPVAPVAELSALLLPPLAITVLAVPNQLSPPGAELELPAPTFTV